MAKDVSGALTGVMLDGIPFDVPADINVTEMGSKFEVEMLPSSGRNMKKMTPRVQSREGVVVNTNAAERVLLKALSERVDNFSMSYTTADGSTYTAVGSINYESRETDTNRSSIQMLPINGWDNFIA